MTEHGSRTGQMPRVWLPTTLRSIIPCLYCWHGRTRQGRDKKRSGSTVPYVCLLAAAPGAPAFAAAFACASPFTGMVTVVSPRPPLPPSHQEAATAPALTPSLVGRGRGQPRPHLPLLAAAAMARHQRSTTKALLKSNTDTPCTAMRHLAQNHPDTVFCIFCCSVVLKRQTYSSSGASYNE